MGTDQNPLYRTSYLGLHQVTKFFIHISGNSKVILKFADVRREAAIMSALKKMNELWKKLEIRAPSR
jgi:hypothetical protein